MKKNQKGKTAVIITGILFAASLIFLIAALILNFSSGKGGGTKTENNKETKPSAESVLNSGTDSQTSEAGESNTNVKETQEQSGNGTQGQTESEEVKRQLVFAERKKQ